jgi:hypothetical protein
MVTLRQQGRSTRIYPRLGILICRYKVGRTHNRLKYSFYMGRFRIYTDITVVFSSIRP